MNKRRSRRRQLKIGVFEGEKMVGWKTVTGDVAREHCWQSLQNFGKSVWNREPLVPFGFAEVAIPFGGTTVGDIYRANRHIAQKQKLGLS